MKLTKPCVYAATLISLLTISVPGQARDFDPPVVFSNDHFKVEINQILNHEECVAEKDLIWNVPQMKIDEAEKLGKRYVCIDVTVTMLRAPLDNNNVFVGASCFQAIDDEGFVSQYDAGIKNNISADLTVGRKARGRAGFRIDKGRELAELEFSPEVKMTTGEDMILTGRIPPEDK